MPRARDPNRKRAFEIYKENCGNIDLIEIASQLNISAGTVRGWKSKDNWEGQLNGTLRKKTTERSKKKGAQPGNKNSAGGPPGNKKAEKYGFFSKYLPEETVSIIQEMPTDPLDVLWDQIQIAYAAIIRAQQIMYVKDRDDKTVEKVAESSGEVLSEKWEVQQAWEKQASFLAAQARAQKTLEGMINRYEELLHKNWELATDEQKARIEQMKAKTNQIKGGEQNAVEDKVMKLFEAIGGALDAES